MRLTSRIAIISIIITVSVLCCAAIAESKTIVLPNDLKIIEAEAFMNDTSLEKVIVPDGATWIESRALAYSSITEVDIPASVIGIADDAFEGCSDIIIYGYSGSYAETWANENQLTFVRKDPDGLEFSIDEDTGTYVVSGYHGDTGDVYIPGTYQGISVTGIGAGAFFRNQTITSIHLPKSITRIGDMAFYACINLSGNLDLSEGITIIGKGAFLGCAGLTGDLVLPKHLTFIETDAFFDCSGFTGDLNIPEGVTAIGDHAFLGCSGFNGTLYLPAGIHAIGAGAFQMCSGLTGDLNIPPHIDTIADYTFYECENLTGDLVIPDGVQSIGAYAFGSCHGMSGSLVLPDSLVFIGDSAFATCPLSGHLLIPHGVHSIGEFAFSYCEQFDGLTLLEGIQTIGKGAFYNCFNMTGLLTIPDGTIEIGAEAFNSCHFSGGLLLPDSITEIGEGAFVGCQFDAVLQLPNGLEHIRDSTFSGCRFTGTLTIPETVSSIGAYAFSENGFTGTLRFPEGLISIGAHAFQGCAGLESLSLPSHLESLGDRAFANCTGLTGVMIIPSSVISLGGGIFAGCADLTAIEIDPDNAAFRYEDGFVMSADGKKVIAWIVEDANSCIVPEGSEIIGAHAFDGCAQLTSVILPESLVAIEQYAFSDCVVLAELDLPEGVTSIGEGAFERCLALEEIVLPDALCSLGSMAFRHCYNLQAIDIPAGIIEIGTSTFNSCSSLESVSLPSSLIHIGPFAFFGCSQLSEISIPASVCWFEDDVFTYCAADLVIYGKSGSLAETYAHEYSIAFVNADIAGSSYSYSNVEYYFRGLLPKDAMVNAYDLFTLGIENSFYEIDLPNITVDEFYTIARAYSLDHGEHFWFTGGYVMESMGTYIKIYPEYSISGDELNRARTAFDNAVADAVQSADLVGEKAAHDGLCEMISYEITNDSHNAYGAMVDHKAVCDGYAKAFNCLMQKAGIPSILVIGTSTDPATGETDNHMWNAVKVDGTWYHVDTTLDDQADSVCHDLFNAPTGIITEDHDIFEIELPWPF